LHGFVLDVADDVAGIVRDQLPHREGLQLPCLNGFPGVVIVADQQRRVGGHRGCD
jgi:hypothetical protein